MLPNLMSIKRVVLFGNRYNGFSTEFLVVDRGDTVKFDWTAAGKEIKFYEVLENGVRS